MPFLYWVLSGHKEIGLRYDNVIKYVWSYLNCVGCIVNIISALVLLASVSSPGPERKLFFLFKRNLNVLGGKYIKQLISNS